MGKQTAKQLLESMYVNEANFEYILQTRKINGSLYNDIKRYGDMRVSEEIEMKGMVSKEDAIKAFKSVIDTYCICDSTIGKCESCLELEAFEQQLNQLNGQNNESSKNKDN